MKITMIMAMTLDGKIAEDKNDLINWTSKEDKEHFYKITKKIGAVVIGMNTFKLFKQPLKDRINIVIYNGKTKYKDGVWFYGGEISRLGNWAERHGIKELALCGGSKTNWEVFASQQVNDLYITIEPRFFGEGLSLFNKKFYAERYLEFVSFEKLNKDSILLHYKVK